MRCRPAVLFVLLALACANLARARDIFVDNLAGDDRGNGAAPRAGEGLSGPVRTIAKALRLVRPGDRVVLTKTAQPYHESVVLTGSRLSESHLGPLIIEGRGAVLDGTAPVPADGWRHHVGDVFCFSPQRLGYQQLYLDGRPALRRPATSADHTLPNLQPLEWCFSQGQIYFCVEAGRLPEQYSLSYCVLGTGLRLYYVHNVLVRDLTIQGYQLDGIAVCDVVDGARFERVRLRGNGRSGISIRGASRAEVENSVLGGNGASQLRQYDFAQTWLYKTRLLSAAAPAIELLGGELKIDGVDVERLAPPAVDAVERPAP